MKQLREKSWTQVYLLSGLCSITRKDSSKTVSLRHESLAMAVQTLKSEILQCIDLINSNVVSPHLKCVIAPVTGMNLNQYNKNATDEETDIQQNLLNEIISQINEVIIDINTSNGVATPWTSRLVHKRNRKSFVHNYSLLSSDGCHLSDRLRAHWARALSDAIIKNS